MNDSKRVWAWVGVAVVVIVAIVWVVWAAWAPGSPQGTPTASGPMPVYATQGQLVPQFPKDLILDSDAVITGSYSINYSSSTNQYTAEYDSSSSVPSLYAEYQTYFATSTWAVTGSSTANSAFDVITAAQVGGQVQVVINTQNGGGSQVVIGYLVQ